MRRLSKAGFTPEFVQRAILPDWWDDDCSHDPRLVQNIEIRIARFLGLPVQAVSGPTSALNPPRYPDAQLRRTRGTRRDRLAPAIHAATRIAAAAVRNLRDTVPLPQPPPTDGHLWRERIAGTRSAPTLTHIVEDLWQLGIPVVPLDLLPTPSFQGMACIVAERPVILIGHKHDEPARAAFVVAHEAAHIAAGDCAAGRPVVDEEDEIADTEETERRADLYATRVLLGRAGEYSFPDVGSMDFKQLATHAVRLEQTRGADASFFIFSWARQTSDYATARMAVRALYRHTGARRQLHQLFEKYIDTAAATETDRALLLCVHRAPSPDEAAH